MKDNFLFVRIFSLILVVSFLLTGCGRLQINEGGVLLEESHSVDADAAASVKVQIEMSLGNLNISSSDAKLMDGTFRYNVTEWKPQVVYQVSGNQGTLLVNQPDSDKFPGLVKNGENSWDLHLSRVIPLDLDIVVGVGESKIDLTQIDLSNLAIDTGAGDLNLDLRGNWAHDINIAIKSGIGEITLHLPEEMGTRVEVKNGLGGVNRNGMTKDGNAFVNNSYGQSPYTLFIQIENGTGSVNLEG